ncbi:hypothetical protein Tco_1101733 [Tanacetum coccineum]
MVKTSFKKLKNHLASFDKVVKVRSTPDAMTEGSWGFEHTKEVFMKEVIPFIKTLSELFNNFDNGLNLELNEVKTVFNQMEAAVEQCFVDKKYFDIQKKQLFLDNDRFLEHIICQDVINIVMHADSVPVNVLPANNKCLVHDNLAIERLQQENDHLFELLLSQDIVHIYVNSLGTTTNCREMQQSFINEYNKNLMLKVELAIPEHLVVKKVSNEVDLLPNNAKFIAPGMFRLDLEPLAPRVVKNMDAHIDYIKHTHEHANILRELVKHARAFRPLDNDLDFACQKFTIDGTRCPFTRITSTNVVPPNNPLRTIVTKKTKPRRNNPEMLKDVTNISPRSRARLSKLFSDIGIFIGYAPTKKAYRICNKRTHLIIETIHVDFDELTTMASEQFSSGPELKILTPGTISSGLVPNPPSPTPYVPPTKKDWDILFQPMFDEYSNLPLSVASLVHEVVAPEPADPTVIPSGFEEQFHDIEVAHLDNDPFFGVLIPEPNSKESSSRDVILTNVHSVNQPPENLGK